MGRGDFSRKEALARIDRLDKQGRYQLMKSQMRVVKGHAFFGFEKFDTSISGTDIDNACESTKYTFDGGLFFISGEVCGALGRTSSRDHPKDFLLSYGVKKIDVDLLSIMRKAYSLYHKRKTQERIARDVSGREAHESKRKRLTELSQDATQ